MTSIRLGLSSIGELCRAAANTAWARFSVAGQMESGQAVMEWVLLLGVIIVPMTLLIFSLTVSLEGFYALTSWMIALPFP